MAETTPARPRPRALAAFGVATLVLLFVAALGVTLVLASRSDDGPPTELAARVPATVELFVGFDTDLASDRWAHLERLLGTLGVLDRLREERDDAFAEVQIDFDLEIMPVLTEIEHSALVFELPGGFDGEPQFAFLIETRDEPGLLDLLDRLQFEDEPRTALEEFVDDDLQLTITEYYGPRDSAEPELVVATGGGIVYVGQSADYIRSLVRRARSGETLDGLPAFKELAGAADDEALTFAFVDTRELLESAAEQLGGLAFPFVPLGTDATPSGAIGGLTEETPRYLASTISAERGGFRWELLVLNDGSSGALASVVGQPDIEAAAAATPREARLFFVAAGLGEQIEDQLVLVREGGGDGADLTEELLDQFREETGVDLERDLLPRLRGTFAFSLGVRALELEEPDFVLFLTETDDHQALAREIERLQRAAERECDCDLEIAIGEHAGFSFVGWPDRRIERRLEGPETLRESENFQTTLAMLPGDPAGLLYLDLGFVFDELAESGEIPADEFNPDAVRGFGLSWSRDGDIGRVSIAVPIEAPE